MNAAVLPDDDDAIVRENLATQIYRAVMHRIVTRTYAPGERISIQSVANAFDVSVTPVREAFQRLAREGLVESRPRSGTRVARITLEDVVHIYEVRLLVETHAAATDVDADTLRHMRAAMDGMEALASDRIYEEFEAYWTYSGYDARFHALLVESTGNPRLVRIHRDLHVHSIIAPILFGLKAISRADEQREEHARIVDALERGDRDRAAAAVRGHLSRTLDVLRERWPEAHHDGE